MCQVAPFTLPCCRKVYVEVTKVPSCPNSWPNRKCPPELCIQVRGYEPEDRESGVCWRCKARAAGVSGADRESFRPRIDKATLVLGLDELGITGRRRREEQNGNCWFCGATGGCKTCGAKEMEPDEDEVKIEVTGKRKRDFGSSKGKEVVKKVKVEKRDQQALTQSLRYPSPNAAPHSQYPYPQFYNQEHQGFGQSPQTDLHGYGSNELQHSRVPQTDVTTYIEAGPIQYPLPANWQSIYTHQNSSSEPANSYHGHQTSQSADDGGQRNATAHSYSSEHLSHSNFNTHPSLYGNEGPSSASAGLWFDLVEQDDEEHVEVKSRYHSNEHRSRNVANMYPPLKQNDAPRLSNTYTGEQQSDQYILERESQDYKPPEYDSNGYPPNPYADRQPESDLYNQDSDAQGSFNGYAGQNEKNPAADDDLQLVLKHEKSSQDSLSYQDPNIQPGLDDLPLQCDLTKIDDATLARLLKKYGGDVEGNGGNSNVDVKST
ncbi:hypothetical protein DL98DRAFT_88826 [Cadophora sp. DSE1049]|nr:hypothetical protein DL98DRAFT_88826 [Cadophora sp. DSE1049]